MTMAQRSELDYLIYNYLLGYADLILNGDPGIFEECDRELWVGGLTGSSNYTKAQYFLGDAALLHLNT